jgi:hypothetical protein
MGIKLIYPTINLFQYNLREGLGDSDAVKLARSRSFYSKFLPDLEEKELETYRQREQSDREFNELLYIDEKSSVYLALSPPLDGYYSPVQLGDAYALHLNFSGKFDGNIMDKSPQDLDAAVTNLKEYLKAEKNLPELDGNSFGQTWMLVAFVDNPQANKLEIARSCDRQITGDLSNESIRSIGRGVWMDGEIFEFWTPPLTVRDGLKTILNKCHHTLVCLFPTDKFDDVNSLLPHNYKDWIRLCHFRHKIFYAYFQSQSIKNNLKLSNTEINNICDRLTSKNTSLRHLQNLLFDNFREFRFYSKNVRDLEDQQYTIESNLNNYRLRNEEMMKNNPNSNLDFLLGFETKYANKYQRQISADRAHLDSGLKVLENLSQTIHGTIQIEQTKSDRTTNLTISSFAIGLAVSQVVSAIVIAQNPPDKNTPFYQTSAFQVSLISGSIPLVLLVIYLAWVKVTLPRKS